MRARYERASPGDPPIFMDRVRASFTDPDFSLEYCGFEWTDSPMDPPLEGDVWACTRVPNHPPPHVAEGFRAVHAVYQEGS